MAFKLTLDIGLSVPGDRAVIEADHLTEVQTALGYLASIGALPGAVTAEVPQPEPVVGEQTTDPQQPEVAAPTPEQKKEQKKEEPKAEKPKRESKPKADKAEKKPDGPKQEEVTAAITALANATTLLNARAVLEQFGVKRAAELKPEQYADFIAAAQAAMPDGDGDEDAGDIL